MQNVHLDCIHRMHVQIEEPLFELVVAHYSE
jgi:hypothetical protein